MNFWMFHEHCFDSRMSVARHASHMHVVSISLERTIFIDKGKNQS